MELLLAENFVKALSNKGNLSLAIEENNLLSLATSLTKNQNKKVGLIQQEMSSRISFESNN